jgi:hypothetical protein
MWKYIPNELVTLGLILLVALVGGAAVRLEDKFRAFLKRRKG